MKAKYYSSSMQEILDVILSIAKRQRTEMEAKSSKRNKKRKNMHMWANIKTFKI